MILVFLTEENNVLIEEMNALIDAITKQHEASGGSAAKISKTDETPNSEQSNQKGELQISEN